MRFRIEKLKASDYKDFDAMYKRLKLIKGGPFQTVDVNNVFVSDKDTERFRKELTKQAKKSGNNARGVKLVVGMEMLNLSPSGVLGKVLKDGYILIVEGT